MALPPYTSKDELDASGAPVVPLEPVAAVAPNRGTENVADSLDYLAALQRVHQTLSFGTAPRMEWDDASRVLTLGGDLVVRYVVDDPTSALPVLRSTTLKKGSYSFGTNTMVFIPLGFDADVQITAGGTVLPPGAGSLAYFKDDGEAQQFFRADTSTNGRQNALKYIQLGRKAGTSLQVLGKIILRSGAPVEDFRDEEYAGDTVTQQTRRYVNQDRNLMMYGAGIATFSVVGASRQVKTTKDLELSTANGTRTTVTGLVAGATLNSTNPVLAVKLNRALGTVASSPAVVTNFSAMSSDDAEYTLLGFWDEGQDIFRWRDGSGYGPGDSFRIGLCCDFTPSFLIERILPELVFSTDALAYADLVPRPATNRVAMVVDNFNATRDRIRLITQTSINGGGAATPPAEVLRVFGVSQEVIYATNAGVAGDTVLLLDSSKGDNATLRANRLNTNFLGNRGGSGSGYLEVRDETGAALDNMEAAVLRADTRVETDVIRTATSSILSVEDSAGADTATLDVQNVQVEIIYCDAGVPLRVESAAVPGALFPIQVYSGTFEEFVLVGSGGTPVVRSGGTEVAFRDSGGTNVVDVRTKDVRAHDLRLFEDPTVPGVGGDVLVQTQAPNVAVAGENALVFSTAILTPVCLRISSAGDLGAVEVANIRTNGLVDYVRVRDSANTDERDFWARDLYLNHSAGTAAGAIYFDDPSAPSPAARLTSDAGGARLRWEQPGGDLERVAARTLELSRAGSLSTATSSLSSLQQTVASASATGSLGEALRAGDVSGYYSGRALVDSAGVASANTAIMTGCVQYNTGAAAWYVDTRPFGDPTLGPFRPESLTVSVSGTFELATSQPIDNGVTGDAKLSWTASAQYDDGGTWYPLSVVLLGVSAGVPPLSVLEFEVWHVASPPGASTGAGARVAVADIQNVRLCVHVHSPEFSV